MSTLLASVGVGDPIGGGSITVSDAPDPISRDRDMFFGMVMVVMFAMAVGMWLKRKILHACCRHDGPMEPCPVPAGRSYGFQCLFDICAKSSFWDKQIKKGGKVYYVALGQKIKAGRKRKGYEQRHLADLLGWPHSTLSAIENGNQKVFIHQVVAIGMCLDIDPNELISLSLRKYE